MQKLVEPLTSYADIKNEYDKHMEHLHDLFFGKTREIIDKIIDEFGNGCRNGEFFKKYKTIAELVGCNYRTVRRAVKKAVKWGIFKVTARYKTLENGSKRRTTNLLQVLPYIGYSYQTKVTFKETDYSKEAHKERLAFMRENQDVVHAIVEGKQNKEKKKHENGDENQESKKQTTKRQKKSTYQQRNTQPLRTEIVPDWLKPGYKHANDEKDPEFRKKRDALQARLKEKYKKPQRE